MRGPLAFALAMTVLISAAHAAPGHAAERDVRMPPAAEDTGPRAALIAKAQARLAEFGYFEGPADGVLSDGLAEAIRRFQREAGMAVTGSVSSALVEELDRKGRALAMMRRLDAAKEAEIAAAREALLANPDTRGLVTDKDVAVADPTRDVSGCLEAPTYACLMEEALESVKAVSRAYFRDWALSEIVDAHAAHGFTEAAPTTAARIDDPRLVLKGLTAVARAEARAGGLEQALRTAAAIPDAFGRGEAVLGIAEEALTAGREPRAIVIARQTVSDAETIAAFAERSKLLARAATVLAAAGETAAARTILNDARTSAETGNDSDSRQTALGRIARAYAEIGDRAGALTIVEALDETHERTPALMRLTKDAAGEGRFDEARETAARIEEHRFRALALADIARREAGAGRLDHAVATLDEALSLLPEVAGDYPRAYAEARIADAFAAFGLFERAEAVAHSIGIAPLRAEALWFLAAARERTGAADDRLSVQARAASEAIPEALQRVTMFADLGVRLAEAGYLEAGATALREAVDVAGGIDSPWNRARAMTKVAMSLGPKGRIASVLSP